MLRRPFLVLPLFAAIAALTPLTAAGAARAEENKMQRVISLAGHGEVKVAPDMAVVVAGVATGGNTAAEALAANTSAMNAVMAALKADGIEAKDIQTSNFTVQPRYDYSSNAQPPKLTGYDVSNSVTVAVRKLDRLGALLDRLVTSGANQINGISFQLAEQQDATDVARQRAAADATRKAKLYAAAMGVELGPVIAISEGMPYEVPVPMRAKAMAAAPAESAVPIAAGEQTIAADVSITWEIR